MIEVPTLAMIKLSVLFLYRRIFTVATFKRISKIIMIVVGLWIISSLLLNLLDCGAHIGANYSRNLEEVAVYCVNNSYLLLAYLITDVLVDVVILAQPVPIVRKRHSRAASGSLLIDLPRFGDSKCQRCNELLPLRRFWLVLCKSRSYKAVLLCTRQWLGHIIKCLSNYDQSDICICNCSVLLIFHELLKGSSRSHYEDCHISSCLSKQ